MDNMDNMYTLYIQSLIVIRILFVTVSYVKLSPKSLDNVLTFVYLLALLLNTLFFLVYCETT